MVASRSGSTSRTTRVRNDPRKHQVLPDSGSAAGSTCAQPCAACCRRCPPLKGAAPAGSTWAAPERTPETCDRCRDSGSTRRLLERPHLRSPLGLRSSTSKATPRVVSAGSGGPSTTPIRDASKASPTTSRRRTVPASLAGSNAHRNPHPVRRVLFADRNACFGAPMPHDMPQRWRRERPEHARGARR
jgi:hypothetical protein